MRVESITRRLEDFDCCNALAIDGAHAASNRSFLSKPDCTIRMRSGSDVVIRPKASSGVPFSQVANCASSVKRTGLRSWLIVLVKALGNVVMNENTSISTLPGRASQTDDDYQVRATVSETRRPPVLGSAAH